jgi:uncharacterized protein
MPEFSIPIHDLDAGGREFRLAVRSTWLRGALEGTDVSPSEGDGEIAVRLSKSGNDVVVHGKLRAELKVPCARCLEPATIPIDADLSALAVLGDRPAEDEEDDHEISEQEADIIPYDGETVVLDDLVRDELLLGIPMIPLCSEACPGISPQPTRDSDAGADIDPRLRPLLKLKKT